MRLSTHGKTLFSFGIVAMNRIEERANAEIQKQSNRIKYACKECRNQTILCNLCQKQIKEIMGSIVANLPLGKVRWNCTNKRDPALVSEYLFESDKLAKEKVDIYEILEQYVHDDNLPTVVKEGMSLVFLGEPGAGKTVAATWLITKLIEKGYNCYYETFPRLHDLYSRSKSSSNVDDYELLMEIQQTDFLVVDELCKQTSDTGAVMRLADTYLKWREEYPLSTIFISNESVTFLKDEGYGNSFWSMLCQRFRIFHFYPFTPNKQKKDFRLEQRLRWNF